MPRTPTTSHAPPPAPAPAFDSHPSDLVLVKSFLRPWVARGVVRAGASSFVHAADLYAADPAELARRHRAAVARDGGRAWYFLSPLRAKSPRGRRKARTVAGGGAGWWHGEAGPKPVVDPLDGRRTVGYRQSFSFMRRAAGGAPVRTGWIMVELRLHDDGDGAGAGGDQLEGLVLCKVYRSPRHHAAPDDGGGNGEEVSCAATAMAAAPAASHGDADDAAAAAAVALGCKRKADEEEGSNGATAATPRRQNADGEETSGAAAATAATGLREEPAGDENEISGATTPAELGRKEEKAVEDVDSSASTPARKRAKTADDEGAGAASPAGEKKATGAPVTQLHYCPQCGFHLGALQVAMAAAKSTSETETETVIAPTQAEAPQGASGKELSFHRFF